MCYTYQKRIGEMCMTRKQYIQMTDQVREITDRMPGHEKILNVPTYFCALIYLGTLMFLFLTGDKRLIRVTLIPAICFVVVTWIRPVINRQRPYDFFRVPPVGKWEPNKGKSMPSRHTVSAVAIAFAVIYIFQNPLVTVGMILLSAVIAALRVLSGQHFITDVAAAVGLAAVISAVGYLF